MTRDAARFGDDVVHAYLDGELDPAQCREFEAALAGDAPLRARVQAGVELEALLHRRYDAVLDEQIPGRLRVVTAARRRTYWPSVAGMAASLLVGVGLGAVLTPGSRAPDAAPPGTSGPTASIGARGNAVAAGFARQSALAHVMYAPDVVRPVELGVERQSELLRWLSERLGTDVRPPLLSDAGFDLIGGRLLPGSPAPIAQFMYHDGKGERITLCIAHRTDAAALEPMRVYRDGPVKVLYWRENGFDYAVSGAIGDEVLHAVASRIRAAGGAARRAV